MGNNSHFYYNHEWNDDVLSLHSAFLQKFLHYWERSMNASQEMLYKKNIKENHWNVRFSNDFIGSGYHAAGYGAGYGAGYAAPAVVGGYGVSKVVSPYAAAPAVYGGYGGYGGYGLGMFKFIILISFQYCESTGEKIWKKYDESLNMVPNESSTSICSNSWPFLSAFPLQIFFLHDLNLNCDFFFYYIHFTVRLRQSGSTSCWSRICSSCYRYTRRCRTRLCWLVQLHALR